MPMNDTRPLEIAAFLDRAGWGAAVAEPVAAGFSSRRFARLTQPGGRSAILMDADPDQKTTQFVAIAGILRKLNIAAPEIYAADAPRGLALMQDLGTRNIGALLDQGGDPKDYFFRAADILATLHRGFDPNDLEELDTPIYSCALLATQTEFFLDAYFPYIKQREASEAERSDFSAAWQAVLRPLESIPKSLMLRDFMPNNLMDVPDGGIGVLDFQDAGMGCIAYDLASLCEETRRDGGFALLPDIVAYYRERAQSPLSQADLLRACTIMSAQRHTRFLDTLTKMALRRGLRENLNHMPRIRRHLNVILKEPYLTPVREWMEGFNEA